MTQLPAEVKALHDAEARARVLFEESPNGIVLIDAATGRTIDANPVACAQLGYSRSEFLGLSISDYEATETPAETQAHRRKVLETGSDDFETRQRTKGGDIRDVRVSVRTVELGGRPAFYCIFEDVTARKQAERALRDSEQLLKGAERIARLGSYVTDFVTGRWTSSEELDRIFGIDERFDRSVAGWLTLVHPEWRAAMSAYLTDHVLGLRLPFDKEYKIVAADTHDERWVHGLGVVEFNERHEPLTMRGTIQDISARKLADVARHVHSAALGATANGVVITDRSGTIVSVNRAFTTLTGYEAVEVVGKTPRALKSGAHDEAFYRSLWETILSGRVWRGETTNRRKDGTFYTESQTITPIVGESGDITHFVAIKEDITERMRLQAQLVHAQKMETVGRLAGGIAHDFANLLSVIIGFTDLVLGELPPDHPARASLDEVLKAGDGAGALTRQLLAFSRQQVVQPTYFDANALVAEMDSMIRRIIGEDIELATQTAPDLGTVHMDRGQLQQVIMNLVVNARDAMPDGGKLTITTGAATPDAEHLRRHPDAVPGEFVTISVTDSGMGISDEVKAHLFEPYFTTKESGKGTGLGLATCHGIVQQARGYIAVYSERGLGTAMTVYLPRHREAADAAVRRPAPGPARGTQTIVVVEDEPAVRRLVVRVLEAQGYRVLSAGTAEEAARIIEEGREPWHLLLTDVVLPGGTTGIQLAAHVRTLRPDLKVVFMSGFTRDMTFLQDAGDAGRAFLHKPFSGEQLCATIRGVLDAR